jgi:hypothetical protein
MRSVLRGFAGALFVASSMLLTASLREPLAVAETTSGGCGQQSCVRNQDCKNYSCSTGSCQCGAKTTSECDCK